MSVLNRQPTFFIPHGAGPCFFMGPMFGLPAGAWDGMAAFLTGLAATLPSRPRAALVISGHWEEERVTVNASPRPRLLFDYAGFPPHTYALTYPAPGSPELATRVLELLVAAGIPAASDSTRGLDHGVFVPFKLIYPDADVPVVQLSLQRGLDAFAHLAIGRALAALRDEGVLIVGSGMSYHNIREFMSPVGNEAAQSFDDWLNAVVTDRDAAARELALSTWFAAPSARRAHPSPDHFLPLLVAAGAAQDGIGERVYDDLIAGKRLSAYRFLS